MIDGRRRFPAEWEPHSGCVVLYPHNRNTFHLEEARAQVWQVIRAIIEDGEESVLLFCKDEVAVEEAKKAAPETVRDNKLLSFHVCDSDDTWARDSAPSFVLGKGSRTLVGLDWNFNAYGGPEDGSYWPCEVDKLVAGAVIRQVGAIHEELSMILEGGSIHTDGEGTVLTTEECLLHKNRNPSMTQEEIEEHILCALGCQKMIWLPHGLAQDDDTNGHVDNFCCFVAPGEVVLAWTDDEKEDNENYHRCRSALQVLENTLDSTKRTLKVHKLHLPSPPLFYTKEDAFGLRQRKAGDRLSASYVNFYVANKAIVVPQFGCEQDGQALDTLKNAFPDRNVVGVQSRHILVGGGNIHCITQQVPTVKETSRHR